MVATLMSPPTVVILIFTLLEVFILVKYSEVDKKGLWSEDTIDLENVYDYMRC